MAGLFTSCGKGPWELPGAELSPMTRLDFITRRTGPFHPALLTRCCMHILIRFNEQFISCLVCKCSVRVISLYSSLANKSSCTFQPGLRTAAVRTILPAYVIVTEQLLYCPCPVSVLFSISYSIYDNQHLKQLDQICLS